MFRESLQLFCTKANKGSRPLAAFFQWPTRTLELALEGLPYDQMISLQVRRAFRESEKTERISHIGHNLWVTCRYVQASSLHPPIMSGRVRVCNFDLWKKGWTFLLNGMEQWFFCNLNFFHVFNFMSLGMN
jgi:hypothetical protein